MNNIDSCALLKALGFGLIEWAFEKKLSNEEQFLKEIFKMLNAMSENNFQNRAIIECGLFSINRHSCV